MALYGPTSPPDDKGFITYCPQCETPVIVDRISVCQETGAVVCDWCGKIFEPVE